MSFCASSQQRKPALHVLSGALLSLRLVHLRGLALAGAILIYGMAGSPTPDRPGIAEITVGVLLGLAVFHPWLREVFCRSTYAPPSPFWRRTGFAALCYGLGVAVLMAGVHGNALHQVLRDLVWLGFIALPVLLYPLWSRDAPHGAAQRWVWRAALCAGFFLIAREALRIAGGGLAAFSLAGGTTYLSNSPLVAMAAIYTGGAGILLLAMGGRRRDFAAGAAMAVVALACVFIMILGMQRAFAGGFFLALALVLFCVLRVRPVATLCLLAILGAGMVWLWPVLEVSTAALIAKTEQVGWNRRAEEWAAVWHHIAGSPWSLLFGTGWGGVFNSPAVGGLSVNFTHGALSSLLLKTGLAGVAFFGAYFAALGALVARTILHTADLRLLVRGLALMVPFLIDMFLYASFKSLDFGVLLLLMAFLGETGADKNAPALASADKSH